MKQFIRNQAENRRWGGAIWERKGTGETRKQGEQRGVGIIWEEGC